MKRAEFLAILEQHGLSVRFFNDGTVEVGSKKFANPLMFFNSNDRGKKYGGEVIVKAINSSLFTPAQIAIALSTSHEYLDTEEEISNGK